MKRRRSSGSNKVSIDIVSLTCEPDFVTLEEQESKEDSTLEIGKGEDIGNFFWRFKSLILNDFLDKKFFEIFFINAFTEKFV